MKTTKKALTIFLTLLMLASFSTVSFAAGNNTEISAMKTEAGYGLSFDEPLLPKARAGYIPSETWDLRASGRYTFDGGSDGSANLYTLYRFCGATKYKIYVYNESNSELTVKPKRELWTYTTQKIPGKSSATFYIDVAKADVTFYILFENCYSVYGYVEAV